MIRQSRCDTYQILSVPHLAGQQESCSRYDAIAIGSPSRRKARFPRVAAPASTAMSTNVPGADDDELEGWVDYAEEFVATLPKK